MVANGALMQVGARNWERWAYHADGLATIIRMRGGMHGLGDGAVAYAAWYGMTTPCHAICTHD